MECSFCRRGLSFLVRAEQSTASSASHSQVRSGRRELIAASVIAPWVSMVNQTSPSWISASHGQEDGYSFLFPFGWQEVVIEGQDKVFKDVIEPLESVAETLIKKVSAPPSQKTKLVEAKEHDADGKVYYAIESPNFNCHALSAITIGNGIIDLATITFSL